MKFFRFVVAAGVLCVGVCGYAQSADKPVNSEMTLADLRAYMDSLHIIEADERGVRVQMEAQKKQLPPWFPSAVVDEMTTAMLAIDYTALQYPFVKACLTSAGTQAMTAMWATPGGQAYANHATGAIFDKEAKGTDADSAHEQVEKEIDGMPTSVIEKLPPAQKILVEKAFSDGAVNCLSEGFHAASVAMTNARTQAARQVVQAHRPELQAAKEKYDAANPAPK